MDLDLLNFSLLDKDFYSTNYSNENKVINNKELFLHWIEHGKDNNCILNSEQLKSRHEISLNYSKELFEFENFRENKDIIFNILIRTSNRKNYFKKCIQSIKNQIFKGKINIFVSYDTQETLEYVKEYKI